MDKPVYLLKLDLAGCNYDARVNDCPIVAEREDRPVTATYPINEWVETGRNLLRVQLRPLRGEEDVSPDAQASATLSAFPATVGRTEQGEVVVASFTFGGRSRGESAEEGTTGGPPAVPFRADRLEGSVLLTASFDGEGAFPPLPWSALEAEPITDAVTQELIGKLKALWKILDTKDIDGWNEWFKYRNRDVAVRRYLDVAALERQTARPIQTAMNDPEMPLHPFWERDLVAVGFGAGRLLRVDIGPLGKSPVFFAEPGYSVLGRIEAFFYHTPEIGWVAIR